MGESRDEEPEKENLEMQWENQESATPYILMEAKEIILKKRLA